MEKTLLNSAWGKQQVKQAGEPEEQLQQLASLFISLSQNLLK
jgi:hypothetical protein